MSSLHGVHGPFIEGNEGFSTGKLVKRGINKNVNKRGEERKEWEILMGC